MEKQRKKAEKRVKKTRSANYAKEDNGYEDDEESRNLLAGRRDSEDDNIKYCISPANRGAIAKRTRTTNAGK